MASRKDRSIDNDDLIISGSDAEQIARLLRVLQPTERSEPAGEMRGKSPTRPSRADLIARAEVVFTERQRRAQFFSRSMLGEVAWDMLLAVYIMQGRYLTVTKVLAMAVVPPTTGLRWISYLERENLICKSTDPDDRRVACVHLSDHGRELMDTYLGTIPNPLRGFK